MKKIDSADITRALITKCYGNEFVLQNVFVYDWESDFMYRTKTGYFIECEIKVSRSDFFADFKKFNKHNFLKARFEKKQYLVVKGSLIHTHPEFFSCYQIRLKPKSDYLYTKDWNNVIDLDFTHEEDSFGYWYQVREREVFQFNQYKLYPIATHIKIVDIKQSYIPNSFYYVCPKDLIKPEEVPIYAGLMYYDEEVVEKIKTVKKAPHLHKDMPSDKFWKMMARKLWFYFSK